MSPQAVLDHVVYRNVSDLKAATGVFAARHQKSIICLVVSGSTHAAVGLFAKCR